MTSDNSFGHELKMKRETYGISPVSYTHLTIFFLGGKWNE